jgi:hypothetical protein
VTSKSNTPFNSVESDRDTHGTCNKATHPEFNTFNTFNTTWVAPSRCARGSPYVPASSLFCGIRAHARVKPASGLSGIRCGITASLAAALLGVDVGKRADGVEDGMSPLVVCVR